VLNIAAGEVIALVGGYGLHHGHEGGIALVEGFDELVSRINFLPDELRGFMACGGFLPVLGRKILEHSLVGWANVEGWGVSSVEPNYGLLGAGVYPYGEVWDDGLPLCGGIHLPEVAGAGIELADKVCGGL